MVNKNQPSINLCVLCLNFTKIYLKNKLPGDIVWHFLVKFITLALWTRYGDFFLYIFKILFVTVQTYKLQFIIFTKQIVLTLLVGGIHKLCWQNFWPPRWQVHYISLLLLYRWHLANTPSPLPVDVIYGCPLRCLIRKGSDIIIFWYRYCSLFLWFRYTELKAQECLKWKLFLYSNDN